VKILLPPSETKAVGGGYPSLAVSPIEDHLQLARKQIIDSLIELCANQELAEQALKLGPKQISDIQRNLELMDSPTMPAIDRYTGVLYDALKADGAVKGKNISIQSALFGLIPATTPIPYYRFSWDSKLPGINLKQHWKQAHQGFFESSEQVLDMRSKSYQELAPIDSSNSWVVEVFVEYANGERKPLNHFNKKAKGVFAKFADSEGLQGIDQVESLALKAGQRAEIADGVVTLVVPEGY